VVRILIALVFVETSFFILIRVIIIRMNCSVIPELGLSPEGSLFLPLARLKKASVCWVVWELVCSDNDNSLIIFISSWLYGLGGGTGSNSVFIYYLLTF
jgi:hypothetical protein